METSTEVIITSIKKTGAHCYRVVRYDCQFETEPRSASIVVEQVYPEIAKEKELQDKIVKDLQNDGMMSEGSYMHADMTANGVVASRITELGNNFLKYILDE